jgi:hypothetical protein
MPEPPVLILLWIVAHGLETLASIMWLPMYFRVGLPVLRLSFPLPAGVRDLPWQSSLADSSKSNWTGDMVFRQLSDGEMAFREAEVGIALIRYLPAMHGVLRFWPEQQRGEIVGLANVSSLLLIGFVVVAAPAEWRLMAIPSLGLLLWGFPYSVQWYRYTKVRTLVRQYLAACVMAKEGRNQ